MRAGRFGFQREMNALSSLKAPDSQEGQNVQALLKSTHEIELRIQQINRWWRLWRRDVRQGWATLARFRVRATLLHATLATSEIYHYIAGGSIDENANGGERTWQSSAPHAYGVKM